MTEFEQLPSMRREYNSWYGMLQRCNNPASIGYRYYGARGITVCERWQRFLTFYGDMGPRPEGITLDRRDNDLGYFPENCRWATPKEQAANKRPRAPLGVSAALQNPEILQLGLISRTRRRDPQGPSAHHEARQAAGHSQREWTEHDIRIAMRDDLSTPEAAMLIGRTPAAVATARCQVRRTARDAVAASPTPPPPPVQATAAEPGEQSHPRRTAPAFVGRRFERLVIVNVVEQVPKCKVLCRCDCGNEKVILLGNVTQGLTRSCGCLIREAAMVRAAGSVEQCTDDRPHAPHHWRRPQDRNRLRCGGVA